MKILPCLTIITAIASSAVGAQPYDPYVPQRPYELKLKEGGTVVIHAVRVATNHEGERSLFIDYIPSVKGDNMWNHLVEMFDVAWHFRRLAPLENTSKIWITPMIHSQEIADSKNTSYPYLIKDGTASAEWKLEFQPWFRSPKAGLTGASSQ